MKRGTVCYCTKCGGEYTYKGGRHNELCPRCYREKRMRRVVESREKMPDKKSAARKCAAPKSCAQKQERRKQMVKQVKDKDPVCRVVHELELVNKEREKKGLPPLTYGKYVQEYKR